MQKKGVSVVICTYNGAKRLKLTLTHIAAQGISGDIEWEVIVIDNNSQDRSGEIAQSIWDDTGCTATFKVVKEENPGLSYAKARGLQEAQLSYLIYVDDDNSISSNYVQKVFEIFEELPDVAVCSGDGEVAVPEHFELPNWWKKFQYAYAVGRQGEEEGFLNKGFLWGASSAFRVTALQHLYSLHELYLTGRIGNKLTAGEDAELCFALQLLGYHLYYSPALKFKHHIPINRINLPYLSRLQEGFGASSVILSLYSDLLKGEKTTWEHATRKALRSLMRRYLKMLRSKEGKRKFIRMNVSYSKGRLNELIRFRKEYNTTYDLLNQKLKTKN